MCQKFLPKITKGDKRVFIINGKIKGAISRLPKKGSILSNMSKGASAKKIEINKHETMISKIVANKLKKQNIYFAGIDFIQGDFMQEEMLIEMVAKLENKLVDLVISDMAPNISGIKMVDQQRAINLNELALDFAKKHLKQNGFFLVKTFVGADFEEYVKDLRSYFKKVFKIKPDSSRSRSSEIFLLGHEFCGT